MNSCYSGMPTESISPDIPPGIVRFGQKWVRSCRIDVAVENGAGHLRGRLDTVVEFDKTYGVIDFKTSTPRGDHLALYSRQLQAYAYALENPAPGAFGLAPVTKLGLLVFEPIGAHLPALPSRTSRGIRPAARVRADRAHRRPTRGGVPHFPCPVSPRGAGSQVPRFRQVVPLLAERWSRQIDVRSRSPTLTSEPQPPRRATGHEAKKAGSPVAGGVSCGGVLPDGKSRVLLRKPTGEFDGYGCTGHLGDSRSRVDVDGLSGTDDRRRAIWLAGPLGRTRKHDDGEACELMAGTRRLGSWAGLLHSPLTVIASEAKQSPSAELAIASVALLLRNDDSATAVGSWGKLLCQFGLAVVYCLCR
jgi:hypothetical protein